MSELIPSSTPELFSSETTGLMPGDELYLRKTTLGTVEEGHARAAVEAATRPPEQSPVPGHHEIAKVGLRLAGFRRDKFLGQSSDPSNRADFMRAA